MSEKLREYQVIDVLSGGTFYKVRHKVTNKIFAWKAYDCRDYSDEQIQNIINEVKIISEASSDCLLQYHDTILHAPTKTLYFVLEFNSWRSLQELLEECEVTHRHLAESLLWRLLHELARVCKSVANLNVVVLRKCISATSIFVSEDGEVRVNCFDLIEEQTDLMRQVGELVRTLCYRAGGSGDKLTEFHYSDDLQDIISFLTEERSTPLGPDVVLYHPTVLTHLETISLLNKPYGNLTMAGYSQSTSEINRCDSEKAVELCKTVEPLPRTIFNVGDSPIYCNIGPKKNIKSDHREVDKRHECLSPTLAALALELPGFVPRSRRLYSEAPESYNRPQLVSEQTLSREWMSRLVTLRQREESLNRREKDLIAKEIAHSPSAKVIPLHRSQEWLSGEESNGITLPAMLSAARRRRRRSRPRSSHYAALDSSLSADAGDGSPAPTAARITAANMPRRLIPPSASSKKVHFTSVNPFTESDESVTLTFYELDGGDKEVPRQKTSRDISKFKYFDDNKAPGEERSALNWSHSSPSKQARLTKNVFNDISNHSSIRKTPSKSSLTSRSSDCSRLSMMSARSHWSMDCSSVSKGSEGGIFERTRSSIRHTLTHTPVAPDMKRKSRRSLITFKTPFKFMSSNRY